MGPEVALHVGLQHRSGRQMFAQKAAEGGVFKLG
ncbi:hypothetical protein BH24ACI5_BH24ACI5_08510 [soil metagenome]